MKPLHQINPLRLRFVEDQLQGNSQTLAGLRVLDIGCGGGIAAFALVSKAKSVIGVDHQNEMLKMFANNAERFAVSHQEILGFWPDVAADTLAADVVVSHHEIGRAHV